MEEHLTKREYQIVILMCQGMTNKDIARQLNISVKAVEYHAANIMGKLRAANRTEAVVAALRRGLVNQADL